MIKLTNKDIDNLEYIGKGGNGEIYRRGDMIYKIYRKSSKNFLKDKIPNPSLIYRPLRLNRLINANKIIKHSDLIEDIIMINGKFSGVTMPYYDGINMNDTKEKPLKEKIKISQELVRNSKELDKHFIYPFDYKLNNVILVENHPKYIDLDDTTTKVSFTPSPISRTFSINELDQMIKTYLKENRNFYIPNKTKELLKRNIENDNFTFRGINKYLERKKISHNYVIIYESSNIDSNIRLLTSHKYRVILCLEQITHNILPINKKIEQLKYYGIDIYDIMSKEHEKEYKNNISFNKCLTLKRTE